MDNGPLARALMLESGERLGKMIRSWTLKVGEDI